MKTFLITGGAGFLGINLVRFLLAKKHKVIVLDRAKFDYPEASKVITVQGDIRNANLLDKLMRGVDVVVHTAAALPLYKKEEIFDVDVNGTRTVLDAAYRYKVPRFIHISTTAVYGIPDHH